MPKILKKLLSLDADVSSGTNAYMDDIVVNCDMVNPYQIMDHLVMHSLITKQPKMIEKAKALGLLITEINMGQLLWSRDNELPDGLGPVTWRELFYICCALTGHYPVARSLRVACSFVKRSSRDS